MSFNHEKIPVFVRSVSPRMEKHDDDQQLAVDVSLRMMMNEAGDAWDAILRNVLGVPEDYDVDDWMVGIGQRVDSLNFSAKWEHHMCRMHDDFTDIAFSAKLNSFKMNFDDLGVTFRLQLECDGDLCGQLAEHIGRHMQLSVKHPQETLV